MGTGSGRPEAARKFLQFAFPGGPWKLTAINSTARGIRTRTFAPGGEAEMLRWAFELNDDRWNLYLELGLSDPRKANKKSEGADVTAARCLWADLDCGPERVEEVSKRVAQAELAPNLPRPSLMILSGGGVWPIWLLAKPSEDLDRIETLNQRINEALRPFGADDCWNRDRIARLPGTINHPDKKKAARGRTPALSGWSPL